MRLSPPSVPTSALRTQQEVDVDVGVVQVERHPGGAGPRGARDPGGREPAGDVGPGDRDDCRGFRFVSSVVW